jgi:hypothetical protein
MKFKKSLGAIAGAALGGVTGGASVYLYDRSRNDGGGGGSYATNPYNASDTYNTYDSSERDYYYNAEQGAMARGNNPWTENEFKLAQAQRLSEKNREKNLQGVDQWANSRNDYYASLYNQMNQSGDAQAQQNFNDSLKKIQLQHAARGTLGGSQSEYNKAILNSQLQQQQAQIRQQSQNYVQGIRQGDQQQAQNMKAQQYQTDPYLQAYYQSLLQSQQNQAGAERGLSDLYLQGLQNRQNAQNAQSQIYGGQLGGAFGTAASYIGGGF